MRTTSDLFRIKICGVTTPADAAQVAGAGADAIGLNFYRKSPRFVDRDCAVEIVRDLPPNVQRVGVFVNESAARIQAIAADVGLHWVQVHGDEPPEMLRELSGLRVIRAFRIRNNALDPVVDYLQNCHMLNCSPGAVLLDAYDSTQYGGSGCALDWSGLYYSVPQLGGADWALAGGLNPANVTQAIRETRPGAVDTASGVELSPGRKDPEKVRAFVQNARSAFKALSG